MKALIIAIAVALVALTANIAEASCWRGTENCSVSGCGVYISEGLVYPPGRTNSGRPVTPTGWVVLYQGTGCQLVNNSGDDGCLNQLGFHGSGSGNGPWYLMSITQAFGPGCCSAPCPPPGIGCEPG